MVRSRVELFEEIRVDHRREGLSIRELAARHKVHRRTVRAVLASAVPPPRKEYSQRGRPAIDPWRDVIDAWLIADAQAPRKQRHTARRVWQRLVAEHGADVSEVSVSRFVAVRRRELGLDAVEVFVPQAHVPGAEAEVDFGEFHVVLAGVDVKVWMFAMRLSASGKAFHYGFANQAQEAFLEGHVRAFAHLGGVPARIRYDNLKPAVVRILRGRDRVENDRFAALRSHYGFASFFCAPGKDGAHEKGGIEGEIGRFRRAHLVPVPDVSSLGVLNDLIAACDQSDDARVITGHHATVGVEFTAEAETLMALPPDAFDTATTLSAKVDSRSRVCVRQAYYSVPVRYAARRLTVRLGAARVEVLDGAKVVASHERATAKYVDVLDLDHYLEILARKPGALPGASALAQAKKSGVFTATHQGYWDAARAQRGDGPGTRDLIEVLLAHRTLPAAALITAMSTALTTGILDPASVIIDARRTAQPPLAPVIAIDTLARQRRIKEAKFPRIKRLADFETTSSPINAATLAALASGTYLQAGEPVVLLGDSGTGKTHLLIALGIAACEDGKAVRYTTCANLINELVEAADDRHLARTVARYARLDLLLLDELGYVHADPRGAELLFQIMTEREEKASIAIATNLPFSEWGAVFPDPRLVAAIVDRVTFNAHILQTGTESYRLPTSKKRASTAKQPLPRGQHS